jgi:hyperosmotically inducible protein
MAATASAMNKAGDATVDAAITGKVKTKFLADPDVKGLAIDVDTKDGVVTLNGSADKAGNVDKAVSIAKATDGVKSVDNKLTVKP